MSTNPQLKLIELKEEIMFKSKRSKFTVTVTPEKNRQDKPFVQAEGELTQAQLEAIASSWAWCQFSFNLEKGLLLVGVFLMLQWQ